MRGPRLAVERELALPTNRWMHEIARDAPVERFKAPLLDYRDHLVVEIPVR
jgi:hypothetical protein